MFVMFMFTSEKELTVSANELDKIEVIKDLLSEEKSKSKKVIVIDFWCLHNR